MRHKKVTHAGDSGRPWSMGPRDAEIVPTLNLTLISHTACSLHLNSFHHFYLRPNWSVYLWCLHEWCVECHPICSSECHVTSKEKGKEGQRKKQLRIRNKDQGYLYYFRGVICCTSTSKTTKLNKTMNNNKAPNKSKHLHSVSLRGQLHQGQTSF